MFNDHCSAMFNVQCCCSMFNVVVLLFNVTMINVRTFNVQRSVVHMFNVGSRVGVYTMFNVCSTQFMCSMCLRRSNKMAMLRYL